MKLSDLTREQASPVDYQQAHFDYERSADQDSAKPVRHPVVVVGAGPIGMCLAIDLAQRNVPVLILDNDVSLSVGSRAICFAKRTLEIFDRLGVGEPMMAKGVSWNVGKVFFKDQQLYSFDLLPESAHERPAFINLQQYYCEGYLAERVARLPLVQLRWQNKVVGVEQHADHVRVTIETPEGHYPIEADWLVGCDGSRSAVRQLIGQESKGRVFRDRFLIADIKMPMARPAERWFWFDPPFHRNQSVLLHMQPDNVWRVDFQLGWDADPEVEKRPENIKPRIDALLGADAQYTLEWASVYTFACLRMDKFRYGRVLFAGDAAHGVSPFGARGANSGVQDAENLAWKLALVLRGQAGDALLDTYASEREYAADENILNSTRATDFITPKSEISKLFRDAALDLARSQAFARSIVNSGRLSVPAVLHGSSLNTPDVDAFEGRMVPGAPAADAPVLRANGHPGWLLRELDGEFTVLVYGDGNPRSQINQLAGELGQAAEGLVPLKVLRIAAHGSTPLAHAGSACLVDQQGLVAQRYDLRPGSAVLLRPDQHVCARWRKPSADKLRAALRTALARP